MADAARVGSAVQGPLWLQPSLRGAAGPDSPCRGGVPAGLAGAAVAGAQLRSGAPALAPFMSELLFHGQGLGGLYTQMH